ncbi:hypothetical protein [Silvanigrella aquatica]|uniref:Uncharacterized protein n=1 Tax=Silvanigrella aquatica TaxID=1915309 RepID=A0A1L4D2W8_9BACT|nr:hypothetical protein [Silvanigrella aquatica]APJ04546.1 hypothetical protein AXG55_11775 [Silvanigrella aquatica]
MIKKKPLNKFNHEETILRIFLSENQMGIENTKKLQQVKETYTSLTYDQKCYIAQFTAELIKTKYQNFEKFSDHLYSYSMLSNDIDKWTYSEKLIEYLSESNHDNNFILKICEVLLEIIDYEFDKEIYNSPLIANCLALLIDIGINTTKNRSKEIHNLNIFDYITSNLIARSNLNHLEIRIALVYYLSRVEEKNQIHLQKILSRFGQSLLEHIFGKYFSNTKSTPVAFLFLLDHLSNFISGSAYLAEMGNAVLQSQMLKNPKDFIIFLENFLLRSPIQSEFMHAMTIHISFLLKKSCEINNLELIESLLQIMSNHLDKIYDLNKNDFNLQYDNIIDIITNAHNKKSREALKKLEKYYLQKSDKKSNKKIIYSNFKNKKANIKVSAKDDKIYSHFEEILILAA